MSHEIRTPMNAILGMSQLALRTELDPRQHNYVRKVHAVAESLLGIVNDILDFSKIEAGKLDVEPLEPVLERIPLYHFLHERHRELVPKVGQAIHAMQASGERDRLRQQVMESMLSAVRR